MDVADFDAGGDEPYKTGQCAVANFPVSLGIFCEGRRRDQDKLAVNLFVAGKIGFNVVNHRFQPSASGVMVVHQHLQHGFRLVVQAGNAQAP